jgi:hypothetical protein
MVMVDGEDPAASPAGSWPEYTAEPASTWPAKVRSSFGMASERARSARFAESAFGN